MSAQDERRSQSHSVASSQSSHSATINAVKFNPFDETLFTVLYTFHKEGRFPQIFWI
ncbi:MAG: hypothetical protein EZS28_045603, partial [Streblomastix strix]